MARELLIRSLARLLLRPAALHSIAAALVAPATRSARPALVVLVGAAVLAGAAPARAQCEAGSEGERVQRIQQLKGEILELETIKHQIEDEHHVLLMYVGGVVLVTPQQAGTVFGNAVFTGVLNPDSIQARVDDLRFMTRIYLRDYILPDIKDKRDCFERLNQGPPYAATPAPTGPPSAASSPIDWPAPMDWIAVKGPVRGTFLAECAGNPNLGYPALKSAGPFRLELLGNGDVGGAFQDDSRTYNVRGKIRADGTASGEARAVGPEHPHLTWSATFERVGVDLRMPGYKLDLRPAERGTYIILVDCKPGTMRLE